MTDKAKTASTETTTAVKTKTASTKVGKTAATKVAKEAQPAVKKRSTSRASAKVAEERRARFLANGNGNGTAGETDKSAEALAESQKPAQDERLVLTLDRDDLIKVASTVASPAGYTNHQRLVRALSLRLGIANSVKVGFGEMHKLMTRVIPDISEEGLEKMLGELCGAGIVALAVQDTTNAKIDEIFFPRKFLDDVMDSFLKNYDGTKEVHEISSSFYADVGSLNNAPIRSIMRAIAQLIADSEGLGEHHLGEGPFRPVPMHEVFSLAALYSGLKLEEILPSFDYLRLCRYIVVDAQGGADGTFVALSEDTADKVRKYGDKMQTLRESYAEESDEKQKQLQFAEVAKPMISPGKPMVFENLSQEDQWGLISAYWAVAFPQNAKLGERIVRFLSIGGFVGDNVTNLETLFDTYRRADSLVDVVDEISHGTASAVLNVDHTPDARTTTIALKPEFAQSAIGRYLDAHGLSDEAVSDMWDHLVKVHNDVRWKIQGEYAIIDAIVVVLRDWKHVNGNLPCTPGDIVMNLRSMIARTPVEKFYEMLDALRCMKVIEVQFSDDGSRAPIVSLTNVFLERTEVVAPKEEPAQATATPVVTIDISNVVEVFNPQAFKIEFKVGADTISMNDMLEQIVRHEKGRGVFSDVVTRLMELLLEPSVAFDPLSANFIMHLDHAVKKLNPDQRQWFSDQFRGMYANHVRSSRRGERADSDRYDESRYNRGESLGLGRDVVRREVLAMGDNVAAMRIAAERNRETRFGGRYDRERMETEHRLPRTLTGGTAGMQPEWEQPSIPERMRQLETVVERLVSGTITPRDRREEVPGHSEHFEWDRSRNSNRY